MIVIDKAKCKLYELYAAYPKNGGSSWSAGSGAIWSLKSNKLRPAGWTSADAAGLPIYPGLARYDEVARGEIAHALRFTAPRTRRSYVYPARHQAGSSDSADLPPMGARLRLKSSVNIASFPKQSRVVLTALRRYGMLLADNGSPWYVSGAPDSRWDNDDLQFAREAERIGLRSGRHIVAAAPRALRQTASTALQHMLLFADAQEFEPVETPSWQLKLKVISACSRLALSALLIAAAIALGGSTTAHAASFSHAATVADEAVDGFCDPFNDVDDPDCWEDTGEDEDAAGAKPFPSTCRRQCPSRSSRRRPR